MEPYVLSSAREFGFHGLDLHAILIAAEGAADEQAERTSMWRRSRWKEQVQIDFAKACKWVTRLPPPRPAATVDQPSNWTRPLAAHKKLREARCDWEAQWTHHEGAPAVPTREFVASYLDARPAEPDDTVFVTAAEVRRRVEQARRKSTGVDGWSATALLLLPDGFWQAVVSLWRAMLQRSRVPRAWKDIRIALIEKPDGGYRPLSIGAVLWRALGSASCCRLRGWPKLGPPRSSRAA